MWPRAAHIPLFLYPFLNTVSKTRPFEYLRLTSLGVIGALVKVSRRPPLSSSPASHPAQLPAAIPPWWWSISREASTCPLVKVSAGVDCASATHTPSGPNTELSPYPHDIPTGSSP